MYICVHAVSSATANMAFPVKPDYKKRVLIYLAVCNIHVAYRHCGTQGLTVNFGYGMSKCRKDAWATHSFETITNTV